MYMYVHMYTYVQVYICIYTYISCHKTYSTSPQKSILWSECHQKVKPECSGEEHLKIIRILKSMWSGAFYRAKSTLPHFLK